MMYLYSIKDLKSEFQPPFPAKTDDEAIRVFKYSLDTNPLMDSNRGDFELYKVGEFNPDVLPFDEDNALMLSYVEIQRIAEGRNFVKVGE